MIQHEKTLKTWQALSSDLHEPRNDEEYAALLEFVRWLSSEHSVEQEPNKTLFWLACEYLRRWEVVHDPWASVPVDSST